MYNGEFSNFELLLLVRNSTYVAQILCGFSYKVWSTFTTKFGTTELFILILDIPPLYTSRLVDMLCQHQGFVYKLRLLILSICLKLYLHTFFGKGVSLSSRHCYTGNRSLCEGECEPSKVSVSTMSAVKFHSMEMAYCLWNRQLLIIFVPILLPRIYQHYETQNDNCPHTTKFVRSVFVFIDSSGTGWKVRVLV